jgi:hypothetical protein
MDLKTELRYKGYVATPPLWKGNSVSQFPQIEWNQNSEINNDSISFKNRRLGKLVEEFVFSQLKQQDSITWVCDNLQIQNGKQTVGEIDALYFQGEKPVHLEIVYKFYLYDKLKTYNNALSYWIGPNRKDSLLYKLDKLHTKQFPLLQNELTEIYTENLGLEHSANKQKLCFQAKLFLPYQNNTIDISPLNPNCVSGFYISYKEIEFLKHREFYIPEKLDWLVIPHQNVDWMSYTSIIEIIEHEINNEYSPLVWIKQNNENIQKYFITFW